VGLVEWVSGVGWSQDCGAGSERGESRVVRQNRKCRMWRTTAEGRSRFKIMVSMLIVMLYYLYLNLEKKIV